MKDRLLHLYRIQLASSLHRLRHDLAGEIVVATCSVILAATFFYVFRDFLQEQVKQLSEAMFARFAAVGSHLVMTATTLSMLRATRRYRDPDHPRLALTARLLGEEGATTRRLDALWLLTVSAAIIAAGYLAGRILVGHAVFISQLLPWGGLYLLIAIVGTVLPLRRPKERASAGGKAPSLMSWRLRWWKSARIAHFCLVVGAICFAIGAVVARGEVPFFVPAMAAYAGGLLWSLPLTFQLAADLEVAWIERSLGVSHDQFLSTYDKMGNLIGFAAALITGLLMLGYPGTAIASAAFAAATPAWVEPGVMFQIDGRRPLITIMILILVSLFIATAIIAHPASLLLVALVKYYARTSQEGRFYRA